MKLVKNRDVLLQKGGQLLLIIYSVLMLACAAFAPMIYGEIDSNALPMVAFQHRGTFIMNESDLMQAQIDFPELYRGINSFDDLRNGKLLVEEAGWKAYYFPIYPLVCLPVKLFLTLLQLPQDRCMVLTNLILLLSSLWFTWKKLDAPLIQRLVAVGLLILSPVHYYVQFLCYEVFMFSMLTMSLVQYHNKKYRTSAFLLSLAGMSNVAVMAVGIVMVAQFLWTMVWKNKDTIINRAVATVKYGVCYVPCLIPLFTGYAFSGQLGWATTENWMARFLTYLFDPSMGLFTFAVVQLLAFFVAAFIALLQRKWAALSWLLFLLGTVAAFSLTHHINCGMLFCARYLIWTYPVIALFLATIGYETVSRGWRYALFPLMGVTSCALLLINSSTAMNSATFNRITSWLLEYIPGIYTPYSGTFYTKTVHVDGSAGPYYWTHPVCYSSPKSGEVRKIIYYAEPGQSEATLKEVAGDDASLAYLKETLEKIPLDNKFHYINFPVGGKYQIQEKDFAEKKGLVPHKVLLDENNFYLYGNGTDELYESMIEIKKNTIYKIELGLPKDFDFKASEVFFVDFCAPDYDRGEQEVYDFLHKGRYKYTFYLDSGEYAPEAVWVRIINHTGLIQGRGSEIEYLTVTEMADGAAPSQNQELVPLQTLVEESDFYLYGDGSNEVHQCPMYIAENTVYKIELELEDSFNFQESDAFFVDFWAPGYDNMEQEKANFLVEGQYKYSFYLYSGTVNPEMRVAWARIVNHTGVTEGRGTKIKRFSITEMQNSGQKIGDAPTYAPLQTLVEKSEIYLYGDGANEVYQSPIVVQENSIYEIELVLPIDFDFQSATEFFVDFCGPGYDNPEQEAYGFLDEGKYHYNFYLYSGLFGQETMDAQVRIVNHTGKTEGQGTRIERLVVRG